jgi:4-hydroxy-3-polyprenylbenzoate decarboxylase
MESLWLNSQRVFADLREFLAHLEAQGALRRVDAPLSPVLEVTELSRRTLASGGPALLLTNVGDSRVPVLSNLFGTGQRVAAALGADTTAVFAELGQLLAALKAPEPPRGVAEVWRKLPLLKEILKMAPKTLRSAPGQEVVLEGHDVDSAPGRSRPAGRTTPVR